MLGLSEDRSQTVTAAGAPHLYTLSPERPFLDDLVAALMNGVLFGDKKPIWSDPFALSDGLILLPTRRAGQACYDAFRRYGTSASRLLPRIEGLGDIDSESLVDDIAAMAARASDGEEDVPLPSLGEFVRALLAARWLGEQPRRAEKVRPARLLAESRDLLYVFDRLSLDGITEQDLRGLDFASAPENRRIAMARLADFVARWPDFAADHGYVDPILRQLSRQRRRIASWRSCPPPSWIIIAGSTGSVPMTAELMATVANLPFGAVILPGLDQEMSEIDWQALGFDHPQYMLKKLLMRYGWDRDGVKILPPAEPSGLRCRIINRALAPPRGFITDSARHLASAAELDAAFADFHVIEAASQRDEARAIALIMRETLEMTEKTAALITPDRRLGRRVKAELDRWDVAVDDSSGTRIMLTPIGVFFSLIVDVALGEGSPTELLDLLNHPLTGCGLDPAVTRRLARQLNRYLLRGLRPPPGIAGLRAAAAAVLDRAKGDQRSGLEKAIKGLEPLFEALEHSLRPFADLEGADLAAFARAHCESAERFAATAETGGDRQLWHRDAGKSLALVMTGLIDHGVWLGTVSGDDYRDFFAEALRSVPVRSYRASSRLFIWGPLEARLQTADRIILGGLNEGSWPASISLDPWLGARSVEALGMTSMQTRLGLAAHDFAGLTAAGEVYVTRSVKDKSALTTSSRWLSRLRTLIDFIDSERASGRLDCQRPWQDWSRLLDTASTNDPEIGLQISPCSFPQPCPLLQWRPQRISVSGVDLWLRDPYSFYLRYILKLRPLDTLDLSPDARHRGTLIHDVLEDFFKRWIDAGTPQQAPWMWDNETLAALIEVGREHFDAYAAFPQLQVLWWARFCRAARWLVDYQRQRLGQAVPVLLEGDGTMLIPGTDPPFKLEARADRIDRRKDGSYDILDYKTGAIPNHKEIETGKRSQLILEAMILQAGGFPTISVGTVETLIYLQLSGTRISGCEQSTAWSDVIWQGESLGSLIRRYQRPDQPYPALRREALFNYYPRDEDALIRYQEWGETMASVS